MRKIFELLEGKFDIERFFNSNKELIIKVAAVALAVVAAFFVFVSRSGEGDKDVMVQEESVVSETMVNSIYVDVGGEVKNPKVAELPEGSRVDDAIKAAGGLTASADLTDINRAAFLEDGQKVYIPALTEEDDISSNEDTGRQEAAYSDGKININTADSDELQELTGVGPVTAQKIIDYRTENGRFSAIEDIKNVSGIGDKTFEKFKENIKI